MNFTLDDLLAKTPEALRPIVAQYGPSLVAMTANEFGRWINLLIEGETYEAYAALLTDLEATLALDNKNIQEWKAANNDQAERIKLQQSAAMAVLKVLLGVALAAMGF